jgi:hypothetical protein
MPARRPPEQSEAEGRLLDQHLAPFAASRNTRAPLRRATSSPAHAQGRAGDAAARCGIISP